MLFMVIENVRENCLPAIRERFAVKGRMLPDGVSYHGSWAVDAGMKWFQIMEAQNEDDLLPWIACWDDLVSFEVIPIRPSKEFWETSNQGRSQVHAGIKVVPE
jgi:hypothetical protein